MSKQQIIVPALLASLVCMTFAHSSTAATPQVRGQWMGAMGGSGLRRFYASGSDFGELVNRAVSYQTAKRVQLVYDRYQHTRGKRTRNNFSLISVIDF